MLDIYKLLFFVNKHVGAEVCATTAHILGGPAFVPSTHHPAAKCLNLTIFCNISITIMFITFIFGIPMIHHSIHIVLYLFDQNIWT